MAATLSPGPQRSGLHPISILKESAITAGVAGLLFLPFIGLHADSSGSAGLVLRQRWDDLLIMVSLAFFGRILLIFWREKGGGQATNDLGASIVKPVGGFFRRNMVMIGLVALLLAVVFPISPVGNRYYVDVATTWMIYIMLGWGLNIVVGLAGLLDLGYVAFYAVGAYSYAMLATLFDWSFWVCLPLAGLFAAFFGVILGFPVLRLRGDYLAIVTLGFGEIIRVVLLNWYEVTNGPDGISGIARPTFFGLEMTRRPAEGETSFAQFFGLEFSSMHRVI
ncbi:MAG: ABC transporter permease subunit, partial [Rhodospirillaceae bacterium]